MLQIFLQPSKINQSRWELAYQQMKSIVESFPTKLIRLESYLNYEQKLNKLHFDLVLEANTPHEHISFWGDWMSFTSRGTLRLYKNWAKQVELQSYGEEIEATKPVTWYPHIPYRNDGSLPEANGIVPTTYIVLDTEGAHYRLAIISIGILLENLFPDGAFLTMLEGNNPRDIDAVLEWLEAHFGRPFKGPMYLDKQALLSSLRRGYKNKKEIICRLAHLYRKKHKQNIQFAIEHIGYEPTCAFYSEVLADTHFGTFGFSDVLDPWIAVTQDLESTLNLISASKQWLLQHPDEKLHIEKAEKYDFTYILKKLLSEYILWTPIQREQLEHFPTNKQALEEGEEDLFGTMRRMMGFRVDICPIYANREELFEAFMYHDPKNAHQYRQIIDDWITDNSEKYEDVKQKLEETIQQTSLADVGSQAKEEVDPDKIAHENMIQQFVEGFKSHEQYFVKKAIAANPLFPTAEEAVKAFKQRVRTGIENYPDKTYLNRMKDLSKEDHIRFVRSRIREVGYNVHPDFESWLEEIEEETILFHLHFVMALKVYDRSAHFSRFRLLWDKSYWQNWS